MATAYSGEVNPGGTGYNRIRLRVEYSGTSATCYIEFRRTSTWSDTWGDDAASITFNGQTVSAPYWYTGTVDGTWRTIDSASGFTVSTSGGTYSWSFNNPLTGSVLQCSGTIDIPAQQVAPNTPTVSVVTNSYKALNITWGTSSFGSPNTGTVYLYYGTSASPTTQATSKATTGNSLLTMDILAANTKYYYRSRAKNTADLWSSYSSDVTGVTKAKAATVTLNAYTATSATIDYSVDADGGEYTKTLEYSLDGSTWTIAATISSSAATTGSFTVSGLSPNTAYTIQTRMTTTAGSQAGDSISVTTQLVAKMYGSVNGQAKQIQKMYGPIEVATLGSPSVSDPDSVIDGGVVDYDKLMFTITTYELPGSGYTWEDFIGNPFDLEIGGDGIATLDIGAMFSNTLDLTGNYGLTPADLGFTSTMITTGTGTSSEIASITGTVDGTSTKAVKIVKIYGSVNGSAKLIYEDNS